MPCHEAMLKKPVIVKPEQSVEDVLKILESNKISAAPVVDGKGILQGVFSMKILLKSLIPVSVTMGDGFQLDIKIGAAPGIAKRLAHVLPLPVSDLMDRKVTTVSPDAPLWEGVSLLTKHSGSLSVVDDKMKFLGLITYASLVGALERLAETSE